MNTAEITRALEQDPITSKSFLGVFPSDKLPQPLDKHPCGFVANTDPSSKPGMHWVAFYFPSEGEGEFFDSYGRSPEYYKSFKNFFKDKRANKNTMNANYKAIGPMFVDSIVYFTLVTEHEDSV